MAYRGGKGRKGGKGYHNSYQYQGGYGYSSEAGQHGGYQNNSGYYQGNYHNQGDFNYAQESGGGGGGYGEDDQQLDEIFAAMDEMGRTESTTNTNSGSNGGGDSDGGVPPDVYEELAGLQSLSLSGMDTLSLDTVPSPKMNVGASEFVPGVGYVAPKPAAAVPQPVPPPIPSQPPSAAAAPNESSPPPVPRAPAPAREAASSGAPRGNGLSASATEIRAMINLGAYSLKTEGRLDLSFKGRKDVVFPHLEKLVKDAHPEGTGFKKLLNMDLRNFVAETLRPWEKNPDWFTPP